MSGLGRFFCNLPPEVDPTEGALGAALRADGGGEEAATFRHAAGVVGVARAVVGDLAALGEATDVGAAVVDAARDAVAGGAGLGSFIARVSAAVGGRRPTYEDRECWNLSDDVRVALSPWARHDGAAPEGRHYWATHLLSVNVVPAVFAALGRAERGYRPARNALSAVHHAAWYWYWRLSEPGVKRADPWWEQIAYRHFRAGVDGSLL